jgi:septum formation protein
MKKIVLASQSPRRKQLLEWAEIDFEVIVKETDESFPKNLPIADVPIHIARNKGLAVLPDLSLNDRTILAADTIVVLNNEIIGKPIDRQNGIDILSKLSGSKHQVITGVVIMQNGKEVCFSDTTDVWFHELTIAQINYYLDHYKPYDKAGAYAIQEWIGVIGIKKVDGDFYNVMGLPVSRVVKALKEMTSSP